MNLRDDKYLIMDGYYLSKYKSIIIHNGYIHIHIQYLILNIDMDFIHIDMDIYGYLIFII